jgi:hypothetical protein
MINSHPTRIVVAASATAALVVSAVGPAAAEDLGPDGFAAKTALFDYVQQVREFPGPNGHKYKYATTWDFWSVAGLREQRRPPMMQAPLRNGALP